MMALEPDYYSLAGGRKERVLHARIPPALDQALKQQARKLHVPVSRLIRDLLAEAIRRDTMAPAQAPLGWQTLTLTSENRCQGCSNELPASSDAFLAIYGNGQASKVFCTPCRLAEAV